MNDNEMRGLIVKALKKPEYSWRTARGIARDTGIPLSELVEFLYRCDDVRVAKGVNKNGEALFRLEEDYEKNRTFLDKVVSKITNQE